MHQHYWLRCKVQLMHSLIHIQIIKCIWNCTFDSKTNLFSHMLKPLSYIIILYQKMLFLGLFRSSENLSKKRVHQSKMLHVCLIISTLVRSRGGGGVILHIGHVEVLCVTENLGEPTHTHVPCWMPKPLPSRTQCTSWFAPTVTRGYSFVKLTSYVCW